MPEGSTGAISTYTERVIEREESDEGDVEGRREGGKEKGADTIKKKKDSTGQFSRKILQSRRMFQSGKGSCKSCDIKDFSW